MSTSTTGITRTGGRSPAAAEATLVAAVTVALAGLVVLTRAASWSDLVAVLCGPAVLWVCHRGVPPATAARTGAVAAVAAAGVAVVVLGTTQPADYERLVVVGTVLWLVMLTAAAAVPRRHLARVPWGAVGLTAVLAVVMAALEQGEVPLDVWVLHQAAADRLAAGLSPWQGLGVDNASLFAPPDAVIDGYPYPVPTLAVYAAAAELAADPRWAGVVTWIGAVAVLAWRARGALAATDTPAGRSRGARGAVVAVVVLAMVPGWPAVLRNSWTEPLSLVLIVVGLATWRRAPLTSGLLLGLAAASKQYLLVLLVVLAVASGPRRWRRLGGAAVGAGTALLAGFALGPGYWDAVVAFHLDQAARPDSANLYGLVARFSGGHPGWPSWLGPAGGGLAAMWLGRRVEGPASLALALAGALTVVLLLGPQAFPNYWLLVLGLVVAAVVERARGGDYSPPATIASRSSP